MKNVYRILLIAIIISLSSCYAGWNYRKECHIYPRLRDYDVRKTYSIGDYTVGNSEMVFSCDI
jgi:hypothetical protein